MLGPILFYCLSPAMQVETSVLSIYLYIHIYLLSVPSVGGLGVVHVRDIGQKVPYNYASFSQEKVISYKLL